MNVKAIATVATRAALTLRRQQQIALDASICPFDVADAAGLDVRLLAGPTLEGIYIAAPAVAVFVGSERPSGRRRMTCAHEIGHHILRHGTRYDELVEEDSDRFDPIEYAADRFALALMMPQTVVHAALTRRSWTAATARPEQLFIVAQSLGVGWRTLVGYLERTLGMIDPARARELRRATPLSLRSMLSADATAEHDVFVTDAHWGVRPVDVEVGDVIVVPRGTTARCCSALACVVETRPKALRAIVPGRADLIVPGLAAPLRVRVACRGFNGIASYRYLEDVDDES